MNFRFLLRFSVCCLAVGLRFGCAAPINNGEDSGMVWYGSLGTESNNSSSQPVFMPKERHATKGIFRSLGSVIRIVGDVVVDIELDIDRIKEAYQAMSGARDLLPQETLDEIDGQYNSLIMLVERVEGRKERDLLSFAVGGFFDIVSGRSGWFGSYDEVKVDIKKFEKNLVDIATEFDALKNTTMGFDKSIEKNVEFNRALAVANALRLRINKSYKALDAAYNGRLARGYLKNSVMRRVFREVQNRARNFNLHVLPKHIRQLHYCDAAVIFESGRVHIALRVPLVDKPKPSMALMSVRSGLVHLGDSQALHYRNVDGLTYFAIDVNSGEHVFFTEDQYKSCRKLTNMPDTSDLICTSLQLVHKPAVKSCVMAMWQDDVDAIKQLCHDNPAEHVTAHWLENNIFMLSHNAVAYQTCNAASPTGLWREETSILDIGAYQTIHVPPACSVATDNFTFWASVSNDDDLTVKAPETPYALFGAQIKIREAQRNLEAMGELNVVSQAYIEEMKHTTENLLDDPFTHIFSGLTNIGQTIVRRGLDFLQRLVVIAITIVVGVLSFYVILNKTLDKCLRL